MLSLAILTQWLIDYGYALLFPIVVVEGPIVTVLAGFLSSLGYMNLWIAYAVAVAGDLTGDCMYYAFGRWGRAGFIEKYGHYIGATPERILDVERHFDSHGGKTLAIGKLLHGIGPAFLVAAGMIQMPFTKFFWYNLLATIPKSLALIIIGFYFGRFIAAINTYLSWASVISLGVVFACFLAYFVYLRNSNELS